METPLRRATPTRGRKARKFRPTFDTRGLERTPMPVYDPLSDPCLKRFLGEKYMHNMLFEAGLIDKDGRILEADKHRGKLYSVEQVLAQTEKKARQKPDEQRYDIPPEELQRLKRLLKSEREAYALVSPSGVPRPQSVQRKREASLAKRLSLQPAPSPAAASSPLPPKAAAEDEAEPGYASDYTDDEVEEKYGSSNASDVPEKSDNDSGSEKSDNDSVSEKSEDETEKCVSEKSDESGKSDDSDSDKHSRSAQRKREASAAKLLSPQPAKSDKPGKVEDDDSDKRSQSGDADDGDDDGADPSSKEGSDADSDAGSASSKASSKSSS